MFDFFEEEKRVGNSNPTNLFKIAFSDDKKIHVKV